MSFAFITIILLLVLLLDVAALRWGADSRDTINSPERKRHQKFWI